MKPDADLAESRAERLGVAFVYGGFFVNGAVTVLLGPAMPELEAKWGISHAQAAILFVAQFAASSLGSVVSSFHLRRSLLAGYGCAALGLLGLSTLPWPWAIAAMALIGLGLGSTIPAANLVVAQRNPHRRGAALSVLNLIWGLGATSSPLLFAALRGKLGAAVIFWALAGLAAIVAVVLALTLREPSSAADDSEPTSPEAPASRDTGLFASLCLMALMFFLYVGTETAIGGWVVAFADQMGSEPGATSMLVGSCFWGALLVGRALSPLWLRRLSEPVLYSVSLALAVCGALMILTVDSRATLAFAAAIAGFGLAPIFPLTASFLTAQTAADGSRSTGWVFAFAGFGGAALPWLAGQVAGISGTLRPGFFVPLGGLALLAGVFALQRRLARGRPA